MQKEHNSARETFRTQETSVLFVLNLDIGDGTTDRIVFRQDSIPAKVALEFCQRNNLDINVYNYLLNALEERRYEVLSHRENSQVRINTEIDEESRQILKNTPQEYTGGKSVRSNLKRPSSSNRSKRNVRGKWGGKYSAQSIQNKKKRQDIGFYKNSEFNQGPSLFDRYKLTEEQERDINGTEFSEEEPSEALAVIPSSRSKRSKTNINMYSESLFNQKQSRSKNSTSQRDKRVKEDRNLSTTKRSKKPKKKNVDDIDRKIAELESDLNYRNRSAFRNSKTANERLYIDALSRTKRRPSSGYKDPRTPGRKISTYRSQNRSFDGSTTRSQRITARSKGLYNTKNGVGVLTTNRLYYEGVARERERQEQIEAAKVFRNSIIEGKATYAPEINPISDLIASTKRDGKVQNRLLEYGEALKYKKDKLRLIKDELSKGVYDFKPRTNNV